MTGRENLAGIDAPVLFVSNHHLGLDNPLIIKAVPPGHRRRMAIAGAANLWKNPVWWVVNPLLANAFPVAKEGAVRPSLENMGKIIDDGWSVLIYPEGGLTVGGPVQPFMNGIGLVAVETRVPVVPMRLYIDNAGYPAKFPALRTRPDRDSHRQALGILIVCRLPRSNAGHRERRQVVVTGAIGMPRRDHFNTAVADKSVGRVSTAVAEPADRQHTDQAFVHGVGG